MRLEAGERRAESRQSGEVQRAGLAGPPESAITSSPAAGRAARSRLTFPESRRLRGCGQDLGGWDAPALSFEGPVRATAERQLLPATPAQGDRPKAAAAREPAAVGAMAIAASAREGAYGWRPWAARRAAMMILYLESAGSG